MKKELLTDYLIVGAGIIGLSIAKALLEKYPNKKITLIDKESFICFHSSGRNSGVLHAGFYYSADSLKARFTKRGNRELTRFCLDHKLKINKCGKVVVSKNEEELKFLFELKKRGDINKVPLKLIDEKELKEIEPNARTYKYALWSPTTSTVDPVEVCRKLYEILKQKEVVFLFSTGYKTLISKNTIKTQNNKIINYQKLINAAGLYADKIAKDFGLGREYIILPFKGIYLEYSDQDLPVKTNIYPVPDLNNPFLGVHYTIKVDNTLKIGPTAIPAFWRENYKKLDNFSLKEFMEILYWEFELFSLNAFNFRKIALKEAKKYSKRYLRSIAKEMVKTIDINKFNRWGTPGIRSQLLNIKTKQLEMDFVVERDETSIHILNAVSPAFTASFPFTRWVVDTYL